MNILADNLKPPPSSLSYLPQLDTVRAFAVLLVLWHHWCQPRNAPGPIGVWIFFVLSGFLITRILLKSRRHTAPENRHALLNFYVRRFLRIFPLYYFVLIVSFAASAVFRADWYWYASYLQNFMMIAGGKATYFGTHLWSLAVEEQFYVFWPLIALFAPRSVLLPIISFGIAFAVATRFYCAHLGWTPFQVYIFTPSNFDTLGFGALLAYFVTYRKHQVVWLRRIALVAGAALLAVAVVLKVRTGMSILGLLQLPIGLISLWMVSIAAEGVPGLVGRIISLPPLIYIGRISYGIYVYHYFVPIVLRPLFERLGTAEGDVLFVAICFVVTMVVSSLSWFLLENPINSLKDKFAADSRPSEAEHTVSRDNVSVEPDRQSAGL
jgi:peptidoglycan/LPS O-acetylase OafA/YrhL